MVIPQPLHALLIPDQPPMLMSIPRTSIPLLVRRLVIPFNPTTPDNEYIRRFELNPLLPSGSFDIVDGDLVARYGGVLDVVPLGVRDVVDQHGAPDDAAAGAEGVDAVLVDVRWVGDLGVFEAVVVEAGFLVAPVACGVLAVACGLA